MGKIYEQLSLEERAMIQTQLEMGYKAAAIATSLNRSPSTICRELRRNGWNRPVRPVAGDDRPWQVATVPRPPINVPRTVPPSHAWSAACGLAVQVGTVVQGGR